MADILRLAPWLAPGLAMAATAVGAPAHAREPTRDFNIASEPMSQALNAFSKQAGVRVLYPYDEVAKLRSSSVNGRMPPAAALRTLVGSTGLRITKVSDGVIALSAPPVPRSLYIKTSTAAAQTVAQADPIPAASTPAPPQPAPAAAAAVASADAANSAAAPNPLSELVVTGVRGKPRTVIDSPTPIDVFTSGELENTGYTGLFEGLETLVPSFNLPARAGGGTATVIATGGLRGLNPDQTLILVNGKRRHKTALLNAVSSLYIGSDPADMSLIPEAGVSRIEVLRDGAAAQYGSDAIAGVVNVILKEDNGGYMSATAGENFDRSDGRFFDTEGSYGMSLGDKGHLDLFFNTKDQGNSNRAIPIASSIVLYPPLAGGAPNPLNATVDRLVTTNYGVLSQVGVNVGYNGHYDFNDNLQFYSFGTYSYRDSNLPYTFRSPDTVNTLPQIYPNGFRPDLDIWENDFQVTAGVSGVVDGWSWDFSNSYGWDHAREHLNQSLNPTLGPTSPTAFYIGTLVSAEMDNSLDVTRDFKLSDTSDVQVSWGLQHRLESFQLDAGDPASYEAGSYVIPAGQPFAGQHPAPGAQAVPGIQPADASFHTRNDYAAYGEVGYTPVKRLFVDAAVRYEDYSDSSGSSVVGKFDGRYELTDWLAFRGAVSNGFRAPSLAQEYYSSTSSQFQLVNGTLQLLSIKTLPVDSPQAVALGAKPLTPETSRNFSAGMTLTPLPNLNMTVDGYQIDVFHRIALTSTLTGLAVSNILVANGLNGELSAQYFTNAIDTVTRGVDMVVTWQERMGRFGVLNISLGANYNNTNITHIDANPSQLASLGPKYVLFDRASQGYLTSAFPKTKISYQADYKISNWEVIWRETRYGAYDILQDILSQDRTFGAKWITDLEIDYHLNKRFIFAVGSNNIGNVYPTANGIFNATTGSGQYPGTSPFGFTGGFYYGRVKVIL
jgi:iron complex outermembrane receptor protein